jgi:hypothetical protein
LIHGNISVRSFASPDAAGSNAQPADLVDSGLMHLQIRDSPE